MPKLCIRAHAPGDDGATAVVTPESAGWDYVGFAAHRLPAGAVLEQDTGDREACIVILSGRALAQAGGHDFGEVGQRTSIFSREKPYAVYAPANSHWRLEATTDLELGIGTAPGDPDLPPRLIRPEDIAPEERGTGTNTRYINPILMDHAGRAHKLLVTEVYTPAGNWSSYPPHKHDSDALPEESHLEETYYHRIDPPQGFAFQRVYTDDRSIDEAMTVNDGDVVMVPRGYHPVAAAHGYELYYLNIMAGPKRTWVFRNDPAHDWIVNPPKQP